MILFGSTPGAAASPTAANTIATRRPTGARGPGTAATDSAQRHQPDDRQTPSAGRHETASCSDLGLAVRSMDIGESCGGNEVDQLLDRAQHRHLEVGV